MILQTPNLDEGQAAAARLFHDAVTSGTGVLAGRYVERFGNRISPDLAAELFPDYSRSPEARARLRFAIDAAAKRLADEVWARALASGADPERSLIIVGGPCGCGKERVVEELSAELARHTHAIFSTSFDSLQHADEVIARARKPQADRRRVRPPPPRPGGRRGPQARRRHRARRPAVADRQRAPRGGSDLQVARRQVPRRANADLRPHRLHPRRPARAGASRAARHHQRLPQDDSTRR